MVSVASLSLAVEESFGTDGGRSEAYSRERCLAVLKDFNQRMIQEIVEMKKDMLSNEEAFYELGRMLEDVNTLSYEAYMRLSSDEDCAEILKRYFTPRNFLSMARDESGCVGKDDLMRFVQRTIDVESTIVGLLRHTVCDDSISDTAGGEGGAGGADGSWGVKGISGIDGKVGYITEQELERFIFELIPSIPGCRDLDFRFYPFYVYTATRYFLFYLDPHHTKRISIKKLSHSYVMEELLFFKRISKRENDLSPTTFSHQVENNWFEGKNAEKLYNMYIDLDYDGSGTLSQDELFQFSGVKENENVQLSKTVIRRIYEETIAYQPAEMDYKGFLDLVIALDNKSSVESMAYFWRILDIDKKGRLGPEIINLFYRDIYDSLCANGYDAPSPANVVVEIYDLLACSDPRGPTFKDMVASGQGHVAIAMLTDETGFWHYDNRENLIAQPGPR